jgi:hypothetical protein
MGSKRGLLILATPLAGVLLLIAALAARRGPGPAGNLPARRTEARITASPAYVAPAPPAAAPPKPAAAEAVSRAVDENRLRSTYQNYRTAVATANQHLQDALRPVLLKDRDAAINIAEDELSRSAYGADREIAQKALEALRR